MRTTLQPARGYGTQALQSWFNRNLRAAQNSIGVGHSARLDDRFLIGNPLLRKSLLDLFSKRSGHCLIPHLVCLTLFESVASHRHGAASKVVKSASSGPGLGTGRHSSADRSGTGGSSRKAASDRASVASSGGAAAVIRAPDGSPRSRPCGRRCSRKRRRSCSPVRCRPRSAAPKKISSTASVWTLGTHAASRLSRIGLAFLAASATQRPMVE